jgi:hypothetical protein
METGARFHRVPTVTNRGVNRRRTRLDGSQRNDGNLTAGRLRVGCRVDKRNAFPFDFALGRQRRQSSMLFRFLLLSGKTLSIHCMESINPPIS